jgi:hypothetical protein
MLNKCDLRPQLLMNDSSLVTDEGSMANTDPFSLWLKAVYTDAVIVLFKDRLAYLHFVLCV